ncbi:hypothetical protein IAQ61_007880 [Plenodomus lingam]|uniref:Fe2OG dioxygenase domain-containing protein n=1 Tax=Leptosphaeria maculans (strain JN3 / isolate v23.1.3 / race Av1-4-5-6-7-8) TaxID=985895 RepID=E5A4E6_LEPMJ|nr:hypothetical protein LEMA_P077300.1 [Plenodomus lingam JN3]KAH9867288.1 hypothetical protein IAQ61_007880 [Plenodomus lingam]CBX98491.1 hypothetical protein LEMA_P077300.1 [Plenodomus lingam JN3]
MASPSSHQIISSQAVALESGLFRLNGPQDTPVFNPKQHLIFEKTPDTLTMQDIGFSSDIGVSPVAVTQAFPLFSSEAIRIMRSEIAKSEVIANHTFSSNIAAAQLRGYARDHAPFTYAAWNHPSTVAIMSTLAGIDLIPWGDYEIAHINLSVKSEEEANSELSVHHERCHKRVHTDEGIDMRSSEGTDVDKPIVGWHTDSYPFVCVLMMSDCTNMVGGETALRTGNGDVLRVRGPTEGSAVILQGRYITHQALRALGARERITAVTSWRPRSPFIKDDTVLRTVRPVSDLNELYYDFAAYRLEIMEQRIRAARDEMRARRMVGQKFDTFGHKGFLTESATFLQHTDQELVDMDKVCKGAVETVDIPDVIVREERMVSAGRGCDA